MKKLKAFCFLLFCCGTVSGQDAAAHQLEEYYTNLRNAFSGKNAYETVAYVEQRWRLAGNTGFNESIFYVEKILQQAGFRKETNGEAEGPLTYRIENRKMNRPTWEPVSASITLLNEKTPLLNFTTNRNMMAINSASTPEAGITADIVYVGSGSKGEFDNRNVKGKIVFAEGNIRSVYTTAIERGAVGVLAYSMPKYNQPSRYVNSIQFQGIPFSNPADQNGGYCCHITPRKK